MRNYEAIRPLGHMDNFARHGESATARQIRLQHVDAAALDEHLKSPVCRLLFATRDADLGSFGHAAVTVVVFRMQQLFDEEWPELLDRTNDLNGFLSGPFYEPASIDEQVVAGAQRLARRFHQFHIQAAVFSKHAPAELYGSEALVQINADRLPHRLRGGAEEGAAVGADLVAPLGAKEDMDGLLVSFAANVPQRDID